MGADGIADQTRGAGCTAGQFKTDQSNNWTHRRWGKYNINPFRSKLLDNERDDASEKADRNKSAKGVGIAPLGDDDLCRS